MIRYIVGVVLLTILAVVGFYMFFHQRFYLEKAVFTCRFGEYACADGESSVFTAEEVKTAKFRFLLHKDLIPVSEVKESEQFGAFMNRYFEESSKAGHYGLFRVVGFVSKRSLFGCGDDSPRIKITELSYGKGRTLRLE